MASAGIFYSLMVLSLLAPIVLYITSYMGAVQTQGEQMTVKFEGIELANYADSIALDVPRVLDIASKRAIVAVIDYTDTYGRTVNDSDGELKHLILLNNYSNGASAPIMMDSSFANWIRSTELIGANHGFIANISVMNLKINHSDPFTLNFSIELQANITDRGGNMKLFRIYNATTLVPIEGFTDPIYPLNTLGSIERKIKKANMTINDTTSLSYMINESWYTNSSEAPSFMERLQGCLSTKDVPHNCTNKYPNMGIESFVNFYELVQSAPKGMPVRPNSTMVDHLYFNSTFFQGCNVTGITYEGTPVDPGTGVTIITSNPNNWFKMDNDHAAIYKITQPCP